MVAIRQPIGDRRRRHGIQLPAQSPEILKLLACPLIRLLIAFFHQTQGFVNHFIYR